MRFVPRRGVDQSSWPVWCTRIEWWDEYFEPTKAGFVTHVWSVDSCSSNSAIGSSYYDRKSKGWWKQDCMDDWSWAKHKRGCERNILSIAWIGQERCGHHFCRRAWRGRRWCRSSRDESTKKSSRSQGFMSFQWLTWTQQYTVTTVLGDHLDWLAVKEIWSKMQAQDYGNRAEWGRLLFNSRRSPEIGPAREISGRITILYSYELCFRPSACQSASLFSRKNQLPALLIRNSRCRELILSFYMVQVFWIHGLVIQTVRPPASVANRWILVYIPPHYLLDFTMSHWPIVKGFMMGLYNEWWWSRSITYIFVFVTTSMEISNQEVASSLIMNSSFFFHQDMFPEKEVHNNICVYCLPI